MQPSETRRSDRITIELPLKLSGDDIKGFAFVEDSRTAVISRHGAKIYSKYKMARDQELVVSCLSTGKESDARIVGELGAGPEGYAYGIEFLNPAVNIWGIEFPALSESERASGRTLLECIRCHDYQLVYLDAMEMEVLENGQGLSRSCHRCTDVMLWKVVGETLASKPVTPSTAPSATPPPVLPVPPRTLNERKDVRVGAKMSAFIRHPTLGEEIVTTDNISRGGFCFRSTRRYALGTRMEVALPYTRGGANIFVAARIEHINEVPGDKLISYGLGYIPVSEGWRKI